jgi:hypothetical protein
MESMLARRFFLELKGENRDIADREEENSRAENMSGKRVRKQDDESVP